MVRRDPDFCPYCGNSLEKRGFEGRERKYCPDCDDFVWRDSIPCASVIVHNGDSLLLVRRSIPPGKGRLSFPGGVLEVGEEPEMGAARELREETGLDVSPKDLKIFDTALIGPHRGQYSLNIGYEVEYRKTDGEISVEDSRETNEAAFWSYDEFEKSGETEMPEPFQDWMNKWDEP